MLGDICVSKLLSLQKAVLKFLLFVQLDTVSCFLSLFIGGYCNITTVMPSRIILQKEDEGRSGR